MSSADRPEKRAPGAADEDTPGAEQEPGVGQEPAEHHPVAGGDTAAAGRDQHRTVGGRDTAAAGRDQHRTVGGSDTADVEDPAEDAPSEIDIKEIRPAIDQ